MAIYVPRARRRRNLILVAAAGVIVGLVVGALVGRSSAPTVEGRVTSVRAEARRIASELRVVSLHESANAESLAGGGDAGADLVLSRTASDLRRLFKRAPWVSGRTAGELLADTESLKAAAPAGLDAEFGRKIDALAGRVESTFGVPAAP
ncbi:MAG TPA: hypothetical protein VHL53_11425 [Acidimicrobiia bacterium]|nr:hypothetical protein [Acidimicrobiia bacterium]